MIIICLILYYILGVPTTQNPKQVVASPHLTLEGPSQF